MPIYKRCGRCGKRLLEGHRCNCRKERHKEYDRYSRDKKSKDFYNSREWKQARECALERDSGIDVYEYMTSGEVVIADTVHHIIQIKDDWQKRMDTDNLMSLHHDTHSKIEKMYKENKQKIIKKLSSMIIEYRETQGRG